jgi:Leucine-rich repeat (LRR) protein
MERANRWLLLAAVIALVATAFISCAPSSYKLSTSCKPEAGGSVSPSGGTYDKGLTVDVTATPATGYRFDHWEGSASGESPELRLTMDKNKKLTAYFTKTDSGVAFPDSKLEASIRQAIGKPSGDIHQSDLSTLPALEASGLGITDLTGLEYCTGLTELVLNSNPISDISSLSGLTGLTFLGLEDDQISDLSPLSGLTGLTELYIQGNQISDLSPLSGLTGLVVLNVEWNQISDVSPLSGLTSLTYLSCWENEIADISPLSGLTRLESLDLRANPLDSNSINAWIPVLQGRGVAVCWGTINC